MTRGDIYNDKNFQYLIIQHEIISCKKISFFKEKRKYFDYEKKRIYGYLRVNNTYAVLGFLDGRASIFVSKLS